MKVFFRLSLTLFLFSVFVPRSWAGGAIQTNIDGLPLLWDVQTTMVYNPENGALKSSGAYDKAATLNLLDSSFAAWGDLPGVSLNIQRGPFLPDGGDVTKNNYQNFLGTGTEACYPDIFGKTNDPCFSPIIFDEDGEILDQLFGECSKFSILGFAGFDDVDDGTDDPLRRIVRRGQALFSGACLSPAVVKGGCAPCQRVLTAQEIRTIITHEVGHMLGMDHSQVNPQVFSECTASASGCPADVAQGLPTMFPILVNGAKMDDLHRDDEAYFERLYGNPQKNSCTVSGKVLARDNATEVRGVEVVARNVDPNLTLTDAISYVSGAEAPKINSFSSRQGNCLQDCGYYEITGLTPGETYQLCVQKISAQFTGGSSIEPVDPPFQAFSNDCPEGLTITCNCGGSGSCPEVKNEDIVTNTDPNAVDVMEGDPNILGGGNGSGGCSLYKPRAVSPWKLLRKSLLRK